MVKLLEELWANYSDEPQEEYSLKMEDERPVDEEYKNLISKTISWLLSIFRKGEL